jgi:hypothetical protein
VLIYLGVRSAGEIEAADAETAPAPAK